MNPASTAKKRIHLSLNLVRHLPFWRSLFAGFIVPLGFAPFHLPGMAILGLALLFSQIHHQGLKDAFRSGLLFGLGLWGLGVSWVYVSIHEYGHLMPVVSALVTLCFIAYLALFSGIFAFIYRWLAKPQYPMFSSCLLFSVLWCLMEWCRSTLFGGFPWLLLGFSQMDTPLKHLIPWIGVFGVGFLTCLAATCLASGFQKKRQVKYLLGFVLIVLTPKLIPISTTTHHQPLSVNVIQANLSMREKWDEHLFWRLLKQYHQHLQTLMGHSDLIVMPESAIPVPADYLSDFLADLDQQAKQKNSAILYGIPKPTARDNEYFNTLSSMGRATGVYLKQHLVPFGEFVPETIQPIARWFNLPDANMRAGKSHQTGIVVKHHPIASLICYELAYPAVLRAQLPKAEWIVSVSDDGWFGRSFAMYQQLQMAQTLSLLTHRYQVVANNDGLSSVIDIQGNIIAQLPAFTSDILEAHIYPSTTSTLWTRFGDTPCMLFCILFFVFYCCHRARNQYAHLLRSEQT